MKKDKILRSLVPSVPVLARTPLTPLLDLADYFIKKAHPEWAHLPPASLRMRIGVGNRILRNHSHFIESGKSIVNELNGKGYLKSDSQVLELGCGCGRNAIAISRFLDQTGTYTGQDVDLEMIRWCSRNLQTENVRFYHADIYSKVYNPKGVSVDSYSFPVTGNSVNLIFSISVFSHLLDADFLHYVRESSRILLPGGHLHMTLFLLDFLKDRLGDRWTFSHKINKCFVDSLRYPEAAVAYELDTVKEILSANNLSVVEIYNKDLHQQTLIARKM
jgi:SAM-dependent methyltransferase